IEWANSHSGADVIIFAIPGDGPHTIQPLSPLPPITDPVVIDGFTQPGSVPNSLLVGNDAQLQIELDGSLVSSPAHGLVLGNGASTVRGLVINRFTNGAGILLLGPSNVVEGCFIGTDSTGANAQPNNNGIRVEDAPDNRIGGADPASRNVISGNRYAGVDIEV